MINYKEIVQIQNSYFNSNKTKSLDFRINNLKKLKKAIKDNEDLIIEAINTDLGKSKFEAFVSEIGVVYDEINYTIKHLHKWTKPLKVRTPLVHFKSKSYIVAEPYGVVLIISPWNYPFNLTISPLIGAIASGNTAIIKPSEYSVNTSNVIEKIIKENFNSEYITVVQGGKEETEELLKEKFDYIFYTGNITVGKIIMEKAAHNLTPVTLELGGKSPCIINEDANILLAAKRIVFGKFLNSGQTCVAPDYLLVHSSIKKELVDLIIKYIVKFYGEDILNNNNYPKIISERHFNRLVSLIKDKNTLYGGKYDKNKLKISPSLIDEITLEEPLMNEEIFGPILPIIEYNDINDAIKIIKSRPKPLALYLFTNDKKIENEIINSVSFGGGCINDTIIHLASSYLPFGGVGESGMGSYHGKSSFDTFSHKKSILHKTNLFDIELRYPPYNDKKYRLLKKLFK